MWVPKRPATAIGDARPVSEKPTSASLLMPPMPAALEESGRSSCSSDHGGGESATASNAEERPRRAREALNTRLIAPLDIRFSQMKARHLFGDGRRLAEAVAQISAVRCAAEEAEDIGAIWKLKAPFPSIEVLRWRAKLRDEKTGKAKVDPKTGEEMKDSRAHWFTLDNRRLYCLQEAALRLWPERCVVEVYEAVVTGSGVHAAARELRKFRTMNRGRSIMIGSASDGVPFVRWSWRSKIGIDENSDSSGPDATSRYGKAEDRSSWKADVLDHLDAMKEDDVRRIELSKKISYILRRGAQALNINMDDDGWIRVSDLLKVDILSDLSKEELVEVVELSNKQKQRYEISDVQGELCIRATSKRGTDHALRRRESRTATECARTARGATDDPVEDAAPVAPKWQPVGASAPAGTRPAAQKPRQSGTMHGAAGAAQTAPEANPSQHGRGNAGGYGTGPSGGKSKGKGAPRPAEPGRLPPSGGRPGEGNRERNAGGGQSERSVPPAKPVAKFVDPVELLEAKEDTIAIAAANAKARSTTKAQQPTQKLKATVNNVAQHVALQQMQAIRYSQYMRQMQAQMQFNYQAHMQRQLQAIGQARALRQAEATRRMDEHMQAMMHVQDLMNAYGAGFEWPDMQGEEEEAEEEEEEEEAEEEDAEEVDTERPDDIQARINKALVHARQRNAVGSTAAAGGTFDWAAAAAAAAEGNEWAGADAGAEVAATPEDLQAKISRALEDARARSVLAPSTDVEVAATAPREAQPQADANVNSPGTLQKKFEQALHAARVRQGTGSASSAAPTASDSANATKAGMDPIQAKIQEALEAARARRAA